MKLLIILSVAFTCGVWDVRSQGLWFAYQNPFAAAMNSGQSYSEGYMVPSSPSSYYAGVVAQPAPAPAPAPNTGPVTAASASTPAPAQPTSQPTSTPTQPSTTVTTPTTSASTSTISILSTTTLSTSTTTLTPGTTTPASLTSATPLASCGAAGTICITLDSNNCFAQNEASCRTLGKISPNDANSITVDITVRNANLVNTWAGVGFSASGGMPGSAVVTCIAPDNGTAFGKLTYNPGLTNTGWDNIDQSPLTFTTATLNNGVLQCRANLKKVFPIPSSVGLTFTPFDVKNIQLAVIMATGPVSSGILQNHGPARVVFGVAQFP